MLKMLKRYAVPLGLAAAIAAAVALAPAVHADRSYTYCDPYTSRLCQGLIAFFKFDEATDNARTSETGSAPFLEPDGYDIATAASLGGTGTSVHTTGGTTGVLTIPYTMGFTGAFTTTAWVYIDDDVTTASDKLMFLGMQTKAGSLAYPYIYFAEQAASPKTYKPGLCVKQSMTETVTCTVGGTAFQKDTWTWIAVGATPDPTSAKPTQWKFWVSTNNGTRTEWNTDYPSAPEIGNLMLGAWYSTSPFETKAINVEQLAVWSGSLVPSELTVAYASGGLLSYPFTTY